MTSSQRTTVTTVTVFVHLYATVCSIRMFSVIVAGIFSVRQRSRILSRKSLHCRNATDAGVCCNHCQAGMLCI